MAFTSEAGTTIDFPLQLPVVRRGDDWVGRAGDRELRLSNLTKVFWPETGYTKGDLLTYYFNVSPTMLPHVADRPLTLKRMPEGVSGLYFYEKDAPSYTPEWMPILPIEADTQDRTIRFLTVRDPVHILWVANIGAIEFHPHHTRGSSQTHPTYAVFDLDPFPPAGLEEVKHTALLVKLALDRFGLRSYPKTSGGSGLQLYLPLDGRHRYEEVRAFVVRICSLIHAADPDTTTLEWEVAKRSGKVFLDAKMNRAGASLAAAYSLRAAWDAPVAMPFRWDELDRIDPRDYTIGTALARVEQAGDPFEPIATGPGQSIGDAMRELGLREIRSPRGIER